MNTNITNSLKTKSINSSTDTKPLLFETTRDDTAKVAKGAFKMDAGKPEIFQGFIKRFPRAIEAVTKISQFGKNKYGTWEGWENVDDGINRYSDAMFRHLLDDAKGELNAKDSELMHAAHAAWGAMAVLELKLRQQIA